MNKFIIIKKIKMFINFSKFKIYINLISSLRKYIPFYY